MLFVNCGQNVYVDGGSRMNQILPQFQKYVAELKLAPEKQIAFLAGWASKFILSPMTVMLTHLM